MTAPRQLGTRQLTTGALLAAMALLLGLAAYYLPFIGGILSLVTPLPVAVAQLRYGLRLGGLTTVAATVLAGMLSGPLTAVFVFSNCVTGMALAWGIHRKWAAGHTVYLAGAVGFAAMVLSVGVGVLVIGPQSLTQAVDALGASFTSMTAVLETALGEQIAAEYAKIAVLAMANVWLWLTIFGALSSLMIAFVWYGVCGPILGRLGFSVPAFKKAAPVERWHLPPIWGLAFIAGYFGLAVAAPRLTENSAGMLLFQLVALVVTMGLRIQGFGLAAHLLGRLGLSPGVRGLSLLLIAINAVISPLMFMLLFWAGMIDIAFDLRGFSRRAMPRPTPGGGASNGAGEDKNNRPEAED